VKHTDSLARAKDHVDAARLVGRWLQKLGDITPHHLPVDRRGVGGAS
jgi:hypothetical protein